MTELEKMQRAKLYLNKLANGIDPISDLEVPQDSALNNVRLSRCFLYVSDILRQVIENGGAVKPAKRPKLSDFQLTPEAVKAFAYSQRPIRISEFVGKLNGLIDTDCMKKISTTVITDWLLEEGYLTLKEYPNGKKRREPTEQGKYIGLSTEARIRKHSKYLLVLYDEDAQRFVMDNLDTMLEAHRNKNL